MTGYEEADYLPISGLQHFSFCRRQWALIHIENQWQENVRTMEGHILHENAHDGENTEKRQDMLITRGMPVYSRRLGVSGACDVVEFHASPRGVSLFGRDGLWQPVPIEYKRGTSKTEDADRLQVCCQAMCLEEMLLCEPIEKGYVFYGQPRRREAVQLDECLRQKVTVALEEMHQLFKRQYTPQVKPTKSCNACSLKELCLPKLYSRTGSARAYMAAFLAAGSEEET